MNAKRCRLGAAVGGAWAFSAAAGVLVNFDDLPNGPTLGNPALPLNQAVSPQTGGAATYDGIVWDSRFSVADISYALSGGGVPFGVSHSGRVYLDTAADAVTLTTPLVLTQLWAGATAYYGFSHGTDQITINALDGTTVLASVTADLTLTPGQPGPLTAVDTSAFLGLSGITGYRIDRHTVDPIFGGNAWIGDDFQFVAVPEPAACGFVGAGLAVWALVMRRRAAGR
jgi:hypothetical protein